MELNKSTGAVAIDLDIVAMSPCPFHAPALCNCPPISLLDRVRGKKGRWVTGRCHVRGKLATQAFAQFSQANLLATAESILDTGNTSRSISANTSTGTVRIVAGTGSTAAAVTDYALQTPTSGASGYVAATINAYSGSGTSGAFTVTGTITNTSGSTITYSEVGVTIVASTYTFLLTHDVFTGLAVSNNGTLATTYTLTYSA